MSILNESLAIKLGVQGVSGRALADIETGAPHNGVSYVKGDTDVELRYITIPQLLSETVSRFGPRDALVFSNTGKRYTYYDFDREIDALASGFLAMGMEKGDRIGIWSPNRYEWVLTQFATARIGLILVNINPAYRLAEVEYALGKVGCKALVLAKSFKTSEYLDMIEKIAPELKRCEPGRLKSGKLPMLKSVIVMGDETNAGTFTFDQVKNLGGPAQQLRLQMIETTLNPDDPINVQFTSGTTGTPKGATLSHYNIINNAQFVTDRINLTEADRLCIPVPLYHCFGMVMGVLGAVSKGATMVFPGEAFEPVTTLTALSKERCTAVYGVPTMFVAMLQEIEKQSFDLGSLRTGVMAGAPCPIEIMEQVNSQMNMKKVTICYGMTETSPVSFQSFVDDPIDKRCATVGRVHPHLEVKIVDDGGQIVPVGNQGELCTRGYSVMKGYWEDDDRTRESIIDGWMHTGDLATFDEEGFCSIVGRVKDMIIRAGENIYPREIEEYLFRHPQISEVQVFGIPDEKFGEEVCAWVIPKPGEVVGKEAVQQFCKEQIAHYKIPKHIQIVDEIPMTITGKPQKFVMRDRMIEILAKTQQDHGTK
jgi:fatty-acyl-CoA synthase